MIRTLWSLLILVILLCGCQPSLSERGKLRPFEESSVFADHSSARPWPEGVVPRSASFDEEPPVTSASLQKGQEQFQIYCSVCHGMDGLGDGMAVLRGMPQPPSYLEDRLLKSPTSYFYQVISEGRGRMFPYKNRIEAKDRWAIAQYIRALQLQKHFPAQNLSAEDKSHLQESPQ